MRGTPQAYVFSVKDIVLSLPSPQSTVETSSCDQHVMSTKLTGDREGDPSLVSVQKLFVTPSGFKRWTLTSQEVTGSQIFTTCAASCFFLRDFPKSGLGAPGRILFKTPRPCNHDQARVPLPRLFFGAQCSICEHQSLRVADSILRPRSFQQERQPLRCTPGSADGDK